MYQFFRLPADMDPGHLTWCVWPQPVGKRQRNIFRVPARSTNLGHEAEQLVLEMGGGRIQPACAAPETLGHCSSLQVVRTLLIVLPQTHPESRPRIPPCERRA